MDAVVVILTKLLNS